MGGRISTRAIDQLVNSASSAVFILGLVVVTDDSVLGAIAIQMTALPLLLGLARTTVFEGILFRVALQDRRRAAWIPAIVGLISGTAGLVISLLIGAIVSLPSGDAVAIAAATFAVLGFDGLRFSSFVAGRDQVALRADLVWLGAVIAGTMTIVSRDALTAQNLAWCYGGAAMIGSMLFFPVIRTLRFFPVPSGLTKEFKFGADFVLQIVPGQIALVVAAIATSLDAVGALRAAVTLFSPLATVIYAVRLVLIDRTRRAWSASPGLVYGATAALYGSALTLVFAVFSGMTERVFGPLSTTVLLLVAVGEVSRHMTQAVVDRARSGGLLKPAVSVRAAQAVLLVCLSLVFGAALNASGLALARATAFSLPLVLSLRLISSHLDHLDAAAK